ncbi:MAG: DUF2607 family protein [Aliivibrio sp.]|nr:DUF2607 family protein [Aliivibrio sp.]
MQSYFFTKQRWLNWSLAITLTLFSVLVAHHQIDANEQHHENHHCQLFHSIGSGFIVHITSPPIIPQAIVRLVFSIVENSSPFSITVHSRAPPLPVV